MSKTSENLAALSRFVEEHSRIDSESINEYDGFSMTELMFALNNAFDSINNITSEGYIDEAMASNLKRVLEIQSLVNNHLARLVSSALHTRFDEVMLVKGRYFQEALHIAPELNMMIKELSNLQNRLAECIQESKDRLF